MQCRLCASCWIYWKKYGGLKTPTQLEGAARAGSVRESHCLLNLLRKCFASSSSLHFVSRSRALAVTWPARRSRVCRRSLATRAEPSCWPRTGRPSSCRPPSWPASHGGCVRTSCSPTAPRADPTPPSTPTPSRLSVWKHTSAGFTLTNVCFWHRSECLFPQVWSGCLKPLSLR